VNQEHLSSHKIAQHSTTVRYEDQRLDTMDLWDQDKVGQIKNEKPTITLILTPLILTDPTHLLAQLEMVITRLDAIPRPNATKIVCKYAFSHRNI
jgi:hypothetical protein